MHANKKRHETYPDLSLFVALCYSAT